MTNSCVPFSGTAKCRTPESLYRRSRGQTPQGQRSQSVFESTSQTVWRFLMVVVGGSVSTICKSDCKCNQNGACIGARCFICRFLPHSKGKSPPINPSHSSSCPLIFSQTPSHSLSTPLTPSPSLSAPFISSHRSLPRPTSLLDVAICHCHKCDSWTTWSR
jgi:hypothetical protein